MGTNSDLYDRDFYEWTQTTASLIRQGKWQEVDSGWVAEELESLGKRDRRELGSRLQMLLLHLLKWHGQPGRRENSHSWYDTIVEQREQIQDLLADSPSLRPQLSTLLAQRYARARQKALHDTGLPAIALPRMCPWTAEQLLDEAFWPEGEARS
ncbi:MAG TPA: DUF29 domain-containing protein [Candidatus Tectomicrobia bacterium]|jgi:hypothetical protein